MSRIHGDPEIAGLSFSIHGHPPRHRYEVFSQEGVSVADGQSVPGIPDLDLVAHGKRGDPLALRIHGQRFNASGRPHRGDEPRIVGAD